MKVEDLDKEEKRIIKKYNSCVPNGYNLTTGGEGGFERSKETRIKISKSQTGEKNHNFGKKGKNHHNWGKHWKLSEETKIKQSKYWNYFYSTLEGKKARRNLSESRKGAKHHNAVSVVLVSPDGIPHHIKSYQQFCKDNELNPRDICKVLKGKRKRCKGWTGYYENTI